MRWRLSGWRVPTAASAAATGTQWIGSGPGTTTVVSDGTTVAPKFSYHQASNGPSTWTFSTTATAAGTVTLPYDDSGFYAYFQVQASLSSFVTHLGSTTSTSLVSAGPVNCCSAPSAGFNYTGSVTFIVAAGDTYGFTFGGSNSDSNNTLQGTLDLGTPQTVTFAQPANTLLGGSNVTPAATASSGLTPTFTSSTPTVCTVVNGAAHLVGLGTCTLAADQAGNLIYDPASSVTRSFTVGKAAPTVSAQASAGGAVGTAISDTLSLAGAFSPTGTVVFTLYGPNDTTCTTTPIFTSTVAVSGGGPYHICGLHPGRSRQLPLDRELFRRPEQPRRHRCLRRRRSGRQPLPRRHRTGPVRETHHPGRPPSRTRD